MNREKEQTILVVDDTPANIDLLTDILKDDYRVKAAINGEKALKIVRGEQKPDMILLDIMMPGMDGYEVCRIIKSDPMTRGIPIIFITAMSEEADEEKGLELGAVDFITKPISPAITKARIRTHLALYDQNRELEKKVASRTEELKKTRLEIIQRLGRAAEFKDNETGLHVIRMSHYSRLIAETVMQEANEWTELLFQAAAMHDIGKIGIPDRVLTKPDGLDDTEWELMKQHPLFGAEIIGEHHSELLQMAREIALAHHEKWDGSGYPHRLSGDSIPLSARIAAVADVFDALTTERPYKEAWSVEKAAQYIEENAGTEFDPKVVAAFRSALPHLLKIKQKFVETVEFEHFRLKL